MRDNRADIARSIEQRRGLSCGPGFSVFSSPLGSNVSLAGNGAPIKEWQIHHSDIWSTAAATRTASNAWTLTYAHEVSFMCSGGNRTRPGSIYFVGITVPTTKTFSLNIAWDVEVDTQSLYECWYVSGPGGSDYSRQLFTSSWVGYYDCTKSISTGEVTGLKCDPYFAPSIFLHRSIYGGYYPATTGTITITTFAG